jgi:hypothetical protein
LENTVESVAGRKLNGTAEVVFVVRETGTCLE